MKKLWFRIHTPIIPQTQFLCYNSRMADYIFIRKSRNALSSLLHIVLNLLLAVTSIGATVITDNCTIGLILVIVSKWRIFAVNHRYWLLNIRSSLVDFIVGISFVLLAYYVPDSALDTSLGASFRAIHFFLMIFYAIWLIIIKPRSSAGFTVLQALIAVFLGSTAAIFLDSTLTNTLKSSLSFINDSGILVLLEFLIGFAASHHVLVQHEKSDYLLPSLICGLFFAEIAWLCHSWLIVYPLDNIGILTDTGIRIPQLSLVLSVLTFAYFQIYTELTEHNGKINFANIALPVLFSLAAIIVLISFSPPNFNL